MDLKTHYSAKISLATQKSQTSEYKGEIFILRFSWGNQLAL